MLESLEPNSFVGHAKVKLVGDDIFLARFTSDCMGHDCRCVDEGNRLRRDACCQHGCDVDLLERDAILARAEMIAPLLKQRFRDPARWFDDSDPEEAPDFPSGTVIRTAMAGPGEAGGCVFLEHDARGCALHRAAIEHRFDPAEIKPLVCRLYPLAFCDGVLSLSDDFYRYSCVQRPDDPSVYRVMRPVLGEIFGLDIVPLLDRCEKRVRRSKLPVVVAT
ncbi:MAG: hypothetical protein HY698_11365 [Deltaproteobacteria bacterium]|nr:hypothetical protein [Deltaproteobacteria bacterium]